MDLTNAPKQFCEKITVGYSKEFFALAMHTGNQAGVYALTPEHAKRLAQYLTHRVTEYEKETGRTIDAEWTPGVESPIQQSELGNSEDKNEGGENG